MMTHVSIFVQLSPNQQEILTIYILIVEFQRRHFVLSPVCYVPICISVHTISFYGCMTKWRVYGGSGKCCNGDQSQSILQRLLPLSGAFNSLSAANTVRMAEMKYSQHRRKTAGQSRKGKLIYFILWHRTLFGPQAEINAQKYSIKYLKIVLTSLLNIIYHKLLDLSCQQNWRPTWQMPR